MSYINIFILYLWYILINIAGLLGLTGVIPVTYRNVIYNIPIGVWLKFDYPITPPDFVVMPTEKMKIVIGKHVTADGKITHPYLDSYSFQVYIVYNY